MANVLFRKNHLSGLLKIVCQDIVDSVHTESSHMKYDWEKSFKKTFNAKDLQVAKLSMNEPSTFEGISSRSKGPDTYCYELLTMLEGLNQSELGCNYLAK